MRNWYGLTWNIKEVDYKRVDMRCICMMNILLGCLNTFGM